MQSQPYFLHALSPLHAGVGQSADLVDLPIARMKATGLPFVPGSSIKGVLRDACRRADPSKVADIFGPETAESDKHSGALVVGDARLLLLPVRSFFGTFAWVTSSLLLHLAVRDLPNGAPKVPASGESALLAGANCALLHNGKVFLEDLDLDAAADPAANQWAEYLAQVLVPEQTGVFTTRFAIVPDEAMAFLAETCTQIDTRVRIDADTGTVADGALWIEESLPAESVLVGVLAAEPSRGANRLAPQVILDHALPSQPRTLQFGGKATVGRGRCRMLRAPEVRQ